MESIRSPAATLFDNPTATATATASGHDSDITIVSAVNDSDLRTDDDSNDLPRR